MSQEDSSNPTQIASKAPCPELPRDVLQHVFSYLNDPFDLANCHLVNTRCRDAARAVLADVEPQHRDFALLAMQHRYPLRKLSTAELDSTGIGASLAGVASTLTALHISRGALDHRMAAAPGTCEGSQYDFDSHTTPLQDILHSASNLQHLFCPVVSNDLSFLGSTLARLDTLALHFGPARITTYEGLAHVTKVTRLALDGAWASSGLLTPVLAQLTTLRAMRLPVLAGQPSLPLLSTLSGLTSLSLGGALSGCGDEDMCALAEALPQLSALNISGCGQFATDAGLRALSRLSGMQHLDLSDSFEGCTHYGLDAALRTMNGLQALDISRCCWATEHAMPGIGKLTTLTGLFAVDIHAFEYHSSHTWGMLEALGPRLQRLVLHGRLSPCSCYSPQLCTAAVSYATRLESLAIDGRIDDQLYHTTYESRSSMEAGTDMVLIHCTQLYLRRSRPEWGHLLLTNMQALRRIDIVDLFPGETLWWLDGSAEALPALQHLEALGVQMDCCDSIKPIFQIISRCTALTMLQFRNREFCSFQAVDRDDLFSLAALQRLMALNLHGARFLDCTPAGVALLVAALPLRILNMPDELLERGEDFKSPAHCCTYELKRLPGRRLRRWPRRATLGSAADEPVAMPWPVLQPHRWPWDE